MFLFYVYVGVSGDHKRQYKEIYKGSSWNLYRHRDLETDFGPATATPMPGKLLFQINKYFMFRETFVSANRHIVALSHDKTL